MLIFTDNDCYNGGEPETDDIEEVRKVVIGYCDKFAAAKRISMAGVPSPEYGSWPLKLAEAEAGGGPMLEMEAAARGITLEALIAKVLANAASYAQLEATIAGTAGKHRDAINALQTKEELINYDWRF